MTKALLALVLATALAAIGVRLGGGAKYVNSNRHSDANTYTCAFFAPPGFSAGEYERERVDRHRRRMRADIGRAVHEHVDLWRDVPGPDNS